MISLLEEETAKFILNRMEDSASTDETDYFEDFLVNEGVNPDLAESVGKHRTEELLKFIAGEIPKPDDWESHLTSWMDGFIVGQLLAKYLPH